MTLEHYVFIAGLVIMIGGVSWILYLAAIHGRYRG